MRHKLMLHPDSAPGAVAGVEVEMTWLSSSGLAFQYIVTGSIDELVLPPHVRPQRADELWRHTCFEAFVRAPPGDAYTEFNFAPSRQWAAYGFDDYRIGMKLVNEINAPQIDIKSDADSCELKVWLTPDALANLPGDALWNIGLSAVIEEKSGAKSYWALAHPPGAPDFHHSDCFALQIPPALRP